MINKTKFNVFRTLVFKTLVFKTPVPKALGLKALFFAISLAMVHQALAMELEETGNPTEESSKKQSQENLFNLQKFGEEIFTKKIDKKIVDNEFVHNNKCLLLMYSDGTAQPNDTSEPNDTAEIINTATGDKLGDTLDHFYQCRFGNNGEFLIVDHTVAVRLISTETGKMIFGDYCSTVDFSHNFRFLFKDNGLLIDTQTGKTIRNFGKHFRHEFSNNG